MADMTQRFVTALGELHKNRDAGPLVELFADDATLNKAGIPHGESGKDAARSFWEQYRDVFDDIEATFRHTVTDEDLCYLEWTSQDTLRDGTDFRYDGVSVFETDNDKIDAFREYYDTAAFLNADKRNK
jgi:ketosteroid isomerase-like protein